MVEELYCADGGTFLLLSSHKTLAEIDKGLLESKQLMSARGEDGMKKLDEFYAECCEAAQQQLFAFSHRQSYAVAAALGFQ